MMKVESMDALVLCGGFATRLEPITLFIPKPLLPIGGRPMLDYIVQDLENCGVDRIVISVNKKFEDQFQNWIDAKVAMGFRTIMEMVVEPTLNNGDKFGAIKGIEYAIEKAGLSDDLIIIAGDNLYDSSVSETIKEFEGSRSPTICVYDVGSLQGAKRFGIVELEGNVVKKFQEKPENPSSTLASIGIYVYPSEVLGKFKEYLSEKNNPDAPGYFLQWLIGNTEVRAVQQKGEWYDIGTIETYKKAYATFATWAKDSKVLDLSKETA